MKDILPNAPRPHVSRTAVVGGLLAGVVGYAFVANTVGLIDNEKEANRLQEQILDNIGTGRSYAHLQERQEAAYHEEDIRLLGYLMILGLGASGGVVVMRMAREEDRRAVFSGVEANDAQPEVYYSSADGSYNPYHGRYLDSRMSTAWGATCDWSAVHAQEEPTQDSLWLHYREPNDL